MTTKKQKQSDPEEVYSRVFGKVLNFISYRPRTEYEIRERLEKYLSRETRKGRIVRSVAQDIEERVLESLDNDGYLNDDEFLSNYIESAKKSRKPKSVLLLKRDLFRKGVSGEMSEKYLALLPEDYDLDGALYWAQKKARTLKDVKGLERKKKLTTYLHSRGYFYDVIREVLEKV